VVRRGCDPRRLASRTIRTFNEEIARSVVSGAESLCRALPLVAAWMITIADLPGQMVEFLKPLMGNQAAAPA